jgi:hypothetical protein
MARKWGGTGAGAVPHILHREIRIYLLPYIYLLESMSGVRVRIDFSRRRFFGLQILYVLPVVSVTGVMLGFGLRYLTL